MSTVTERDERKAKAAAAIEAALAEAELEYEQPGPGAYVVKLPGDRKLWTTCSLVVGDHTLSLNAFVARHPDENHEGVYKWLLERNTRLGLVAFAVDRLGDVYLVGRLPLGAVTPEDVDQLLGETLAGRRLVVRHAAGARLRRGDPAGMGLAGVAWGVAAEPRGLRAPDRASLIDPASRTGRDRRSGAG